MTLGISLADNFLTMYCFYELLTLVTLPLVMHTLTREAFKRVQRGKRPQKRHQTRKYGSKPVKLKCNRQISLAALTIVIGLVPNVLVYAFEAFAALLM